MTLLSRLLLVGPVTGRQSPHFLFSILSSSALDQQHNCSIKVFKCKYQHLSPLLKAYFSPDLQHRLDMSLWEQKLTDFLIIFLFDSSSGRDYVLGNYHYHRYHDTCLLQMDCGWGAQSPAQVWMQHCQRAKQWIPMHCNVPITTNAVKLRWKTMMLRMMLRGRAGLSS